MADATFTLPDATFTRLTVDQLTISDAHGPCFFLTATELIMVGARNKVLAKIENKYDYTTLTFHDHNGKGRIEILIDERGLPEINLLDANGKKRLTATVDDEGAPVLQLLDTLGTHRLDLSLIEGATPSLSFHDEKEKIRFHLLTHGDHETGMIAFYGYRGRVLELRPPQTHEGEGLAMKEAYEVIRLRKPHASTRGNSKHDAPYHPPFQSATRSTMPFSTGYRDRILYLSITGKDI